MPIACRKLKVRSSAAQWNLDALVEGDGQDLLPCFFSVVSAWCTFQVPSGGPGEKLLAAVSGVLGPPASPPQVVKGGSCGGEEEGEFPFTGAMLSVTWEFPPEARGAFIAGVKRLFDDSGGAA